MEGKIDVGVSTSDKRIDGTNYAVFEPPCVLFDDFEGELCATKIDVPSEIASKRCARVFFRVQSKVGGVGRENVFVVRCKCSSVIVYD